MQLPKVILLGVCLFAVHLCYGDKLPEEDMTPLELILNQNYDGEEHSVVTSDGYILGVQRITSARHLYNSKGVKTSLRSGSCAKPVVILQHGLEGCSENFIGNLYYESLGFMLADTGLDVWLPNSRGNAYSTRHLTLDPKKDKKKFWDFSWQQMSEFDLPAIVEYTINVTGCQQVYYVGHSQGTMIMFARLAEDPIFAQKIKIFFALAPVTTVGDITAGLRYLAPFADSIEDILGALGIYDFSEDGAIGWAMDILKPICELNWAESHVCDNLIFTLLGSENPKNFNNSRIPEFIAHNPSGTSVKNIAHFGQLVNSKKFQKFDYGRIANIEIYGTSSPPEYDLTKIQSRTYLYWSKDDTLADYTDVQKLMTKLKLFVSREVLTYSHLDFVIAINANSKVYASLIETIRSDLGRQNRIASKHD